MYITPTFQAMAMIPPQDMIINSVDAGGRQADSHGDTAKRHQEESPQHKLKRCVKRSKSPPGIDVNDSLSQSDILAIDAAFCMVESGAQAPQDNKTSTVDTSISDSELLAIDEAFFMLESGALSVPKNAKSSELIISKSPTYLNVLFEHHACVKTLGGMWDPKRKQWYVPAGVDITYFLPWLS